MLSWQEISQIIKEHIPVMSAVKPRLGASRL